MSNHYREQYKDASYQVSIHLGINRNFVGSILGRASIKIAHLVAIRKQTWPPQAILVSAWLISKKCSLLKLFDQINQNLVGSILGRSSITIANVVPEINQAETRIACGGHVCLRIATR
jgi:hypothetical protein